MFSHVMEIFGLTGSMCAGNNMHLYLFIFRFSYFTPIHIPAALLLFPCEKERALARIRARLVLRHDPEKYALPVRLKGFNWWEQSFGEQIIESRKCKAHSLTSTLWRNLFVASQTLCALLEP